MSIKKRLLSNTLLILILFFSLLIRLVGINFGLPQHFHADEPDYIEHVRNFYLGDFNPHFFEQPSLYSYLVFFFSLFYIKIYASISSAFFYFPDQSFFYLLGRLFSCFTGLATIYVFYLICKRILGTWPSLVATLLFSISSIHIKESHYATNNNLLLFFICLTIYYCISIKENPKLFFYLLSGLFAGLAMSTKYTGALLILVVFISHLMSYNKISLANFFKKGFWMPLLIFVFVFFVTFFLTSPYVFFDNQGFLHIAKVFNEVRYDPTPIFQGVSNGYNFLKSLLISEFGLLAFLFCVLGILVFVIRYFKMSLILLIYPIIYFLVIGSWSRLYDRYLLPLIPFVIFFLVVALNYFFDNFFLKKRNLASLFLIVILTTLLFIPSLENSYSSEKRFILKDTRSVALNWINENIASGAVFLREQYTPEVELLVDKNFTVLNKKYELYESLNEQYFLDNSIDYVIISSYLYERYYNNAEFFEEQVHSYNSLVNLTAPLIRFNPTEKSTGPIITIYYTRKGIH